MSKQSNYQVVAVGNAIVDVIASCEDKLIEDAGMTKGVMQLVFDEAEAKKIYSIMPPATEQSGGSAANTIAVLSTLGAKTGFIGKVADDELGEIFTHDMKARGVVYNTKTLSNGPLTGRSMILVTPDAERTMNTYLGASVEFDDSDIDEDLISNAEILYLEGYLYDRDLAKKAFSDAAEIATNAGAKVALTLSDPFCVDRHREDFQKLIEGNVDILFANQDEVSALYPELSLDEALEKLGAFVSLVAMTQGAKGALILSGGNKIVVPSYDTDVVDTTGAGDAFAAGFMYGLTHNYSLEDCGALGCACAAKIISVLGARVTKDLKRFIEEKTSIKVQHNSKLAEAV